MLFKVSVFGLGYVGSVMAACLSGQGHEVVGVDLNSLKSDTLNSGKSPIVEPGIDELVAEAHRRGTLRTTANAAEAVRDTDISFICVGTPSLFTGKLDLRGVERVCQNIGEALRTKPAYHTIVLRSTMLPGTAEQLAIPTLERASGKRAGHDFVVCANPEFLREGSAIRDFMEPPMTVLGAADPSHLTALALLYSFSKAPLFKTSLATAEMVKYSCNAFHALKVAFANEIASIGNALGVDTSEAARIFCSDTKLNVSSAYLKPGFAFGGSCLPKDVRALTYRAKELDVEIPLLQSIMPSNQQHIDRAVQAVLLSGKRKVGLLGLSFKAGTDDLRESPYVHAIKRLLGEGCQVRIWDSDVSLGFAVGSNRRFIMEVIPHIGSLLCKNMEDVLNFADLVLIGSQKVHMDDLHLRPGQAVLDLTHLQSARKSVFNAKA
jgi:GDP-mannose 6-dehydrogenase